MPKKKIQWWARGGGIARCGPFKNQIEATNAMRLVKHESGTRIAGDVRKGLRGLTVVTQPEQRKEFPDDCFVWPEEVDV